MNQDTSNLFRASCGATSPLELKISGPGWDGVERHDFEQPFLLVGRHEGCGLRLEDEAVSRRHAYLQQLGERIFCVDLGSRTGIGWSGRSYPAGWLHPEPGIRIGPFTLEGANSARPVGGRGDETADNWDPLQDRRNDLPVLPRILIEDGKETRSQLHMNRILVLVGSSPDCRIRLRDAGVSKYHCSLVRTPEGIWVIDLLSAAGTLLNGQPIPWARLNEGDRLQVGPYFLRVAYQDGRSASPSSRLSTMSTARPDSGGMPVPPQNVQVQTLAVSLTEHSAIPTSERVPALQAELEKLRERLQGAEVFRQQWADSQAECDQLRGQVRTLESQIGELAGIQARLEAAEASALELDLIRGERDHWQAETQSIRDRIAADLADKEEEWRQQLDEVQKQLAEERETGGSVSQQLQETIEELTHSQQTFHGLQAELEKLREHQREAQALGQQLEATRGQHDQLHTRVADLETQAAEAERLAGRLRDADQEMERLRVQLQNTQEQLAELERLRTECNRLRTLEDQVAELADLKVQLKASEANARELDLIRAERDHLMTEAQGIRDRGAANLAEKEEEWRHQLEEARKQLAGEREAGRAIRERLDQESAAVEVMRTDFGARNAEHESVLQRLQATQDEIGRSQESIHGLQAELERLREHQREAETLRQLMEETRRRHDQLSVRAGELENQAAEAERLAGRLRDADEERERFREHARTLESQLAEMANLQARLNAAETNVGDLDTLRAERDQWKDEARTLQERIGADLTDPEEVDRLTANLHAAQEERDRLRSEQQASVHASEQALSRVSELERQLADATAAQESGVAEAPPDWEAERRELQALVEQERQTRDEAIQTAIREVQGRAEATIREAQARAAAERVEWRERLEGAETQIVWERQMFQEQGEQLRRQAASLQAERDRLAARLGQTETMQRGTPERTPQQAASAVDPDPQRQLALRDRVLAELCGFRLDPPQQVDPARPRVLHQNTGMQSGEQRHAVAVEQGVEAAWAHAAAGQHRPATPPNPAGQSNKPDPVVAPDAGANNASEQRPAPTETAESALSPDATPKDPTGLEEKHSVEELRDWLAKEKNEEDRRVWRKILRFVRGK
jgi:pSer/pThr/pTyr-binding forkhead associated (FHA) protein/DNA repair exonuclease SbcCD ATPase subunit